MICPSCNTWHFLSAAEAQQAPSAVPPSVDYGMPFSQESPPEVVDPYTAPSTPDTEQAPTNLPPISEPPTGFGYLITDAGEQLRLKEGKNVIGRKNADLIIDDRTVSRRHCVIEVVLNSAGTKEYTIYDIGHIEGTPSTNGVLISGRSLRLQDYERIPISNGTSIQIGNVRLTLQCD